MKIQFWLRAVNENNFWLRAEVNENTFLLLIDLSVFLSSVSWMQQTWPVLANWHEH